MRLRAHLFEERWNEVVLLLAGCRRRGGLRLASDFIAKILATDDSLPGRARAVGLVGRILRDILPAGGDPARGTGYAEALQQTLAVFQRAEHHVPEPVRIEVGEALGQAGDPRIHEDDRRNRVPIPGGSFWMGAQNHSPKKPGYDKQCEDDEKPVHRVTVSDFCIDRYPVTVQQFARFVEAGLDGYLNETCWCPDGWEWRQRKGRTEPSAWEQQLRHPNRPVVGVSWYEADAYCAWLGHTSGSAVKLPTEAQWEFAARGGKGRQYPWGDEPPTAQHANFEVRVGNATPVGIYPLGATPEAVEDLAGNVWEWCRDWYRPYSADEQKDPEGPSKGESRVLRGGGFRSDPRFLRAAYRDDYRPGSGGVYVGFRCVVAGAGGQQD